ncbi:MAG: ATP-binding cassette domain-containing protein [Candidatus Manganitrophus sp.]|nr:ATP-binding cassette domain-containing protein [Candidatus Manganitrophus sp.]
MELREVSTTIGDTVIHREISFTIYRGELFAIVGRSGSGKSVLLREMILLREPGAGSIRVLGRDLNEIDPDAALQLRRRCGVLFQEGALFSALTVAENVATPLREHTALSERLIEEIAAVKIGLTGFPPMRSQNIRTS